MKFAQKYPNIERIIDEFDGVFRGFYQRPCCVCGLSTEYLEVNYMAPFCSEECVAEMDERCSKYAKENRKEAPEGRAETWRRPFGRETLYVAERTQG